MIAYCRIALDAVVPREEQHLRDLSQYEKITVHGEGETWEEAKAACEIPEGAVKLAWSSWPI